MKTYFLKNIKNAHENTRDKIRFLKSYDINRFT